MPQYRATEASSAQHTAADHQTNEAVLVIPALVVVAFFVFFVSLVQQACEEQSTQASAAQHATADQETRQPVLFASTGSAFLLVAAFVFVIFFVPLAQQAGEQQTTQATPS